MHRWAIATVCGGLLACMVHAGAQTPAPQAPPPATGAKPEPAAAPQGRGRGGRGRIATFPAQQRPPADPKLVERGTIVYAGTCSACHGVDARGGQLGGPNLLRSQLVLNDKEGELIAPVIHGSRAERGMPPIPMSDEDVAAVAAFLHSLQAAARPQGAPPEASTPPPDALVGNAAAGEAYFRANCTGCHTADALKGIATRFPEAKALQNRWVTGGRGTGRGRGGAAADGPAVTATVTLPSGERVEGRLVRMDDFLVTLMLPDERIRSIRRDGDVPRIEIHDPLAGHRALLARLTDADMHNVTAFLATLK